MTLLGYVLEGAVTLYLLWAFIAFCSEDRAAHSGHPTRNPVRGRTS